MMPDQSRYPHFYRKNGSTAVFMTAVLDADGGPFLTGAVIITDGAGQFNVGLHARCWVHAERLIHSLIDLTAGQRAALERVPVSRDRRRPAAR